MLKNVAFDIQPRDVAVDFGNLSMTKDLFELWMLLYILRGAREVHEGLDCLEILRHQTLEFGAHSG